MKCLILGCGYLGAKAAQLWHQSGSEITVVSRSENNSAHFKSLGYRCVVADITRPETLDALTDEFDVVLFAVGFDRSRYTDIREVYVTGLQNVLERLKNFRGHFVYISSTGVFGDCNGEWVDEESNTDPQRPGCKACLEAESLLQNYFARQNYTILRLSGIYGVGRIPRLDAILNERWSKLGQSGHINLIHVSDAAAIAKLVVEKQLFGETFLVSDGQPADRRDFYQFIAEQVGSGPILWPEIADPDVARRSNADKKISNKKLIKMTGYEFLYPDYRAGITASLSK